MNQVKIGQFISECRKGKGLTQQELANRVGLTAKAVSKWETGKGLPDVSLYETLCKELGITLNEFFAGEHIEEQRIIAQTDENLEDILKEYYKMKKQKNTIMMILGVVVGGIILFLVDLLRRFLLAGGILTILTFIQGKIGPEILTDVSKYEKSYYIENYSGDLDSSLSVFPDKITEEMEVKNFQSSLQTGLFDTDGYIFLEYTLDKENFDKEVARLQALEAKIENPDGESFVNKVVYSEDEYDYPAYITIDGFTSNFEYALVDQENCRIICIYIAYIDSSDFPHEEYLKSDKTDYEYSDSFERFSMYSHSFDGGETYLEVDGGVRIPLE